MPILKQEKQEKVVFAITNRCNIYCRHCVMGINRSNLDANRDDVLKWIKQIAFSQDKKWAVFAGGEPFLCMDDLIEYVKLAKENNLLTSVITNGFWAKTPETAEEILDKLPGLDSIMISSDKYHMEFIDKKIIFNLIEASLKRSLPVHVNIVAASKEEGSVYSRIFTDRYEDRITVYQVNMFTNDPPQDFNIEQINYMSNPDLLYGYCDVTNHIIALDGDVHVCCGASRLGLKNEHFFLGNLMQVPYADMIKKRDQSVIYEFMHKYGVEGLARVIRRSPYREEYKKATFTHPCEMCMWALTNNNFYKYFYPRVQKHMSESR